MGEFGWNWTNKKIVGVLFTWSKSWTCLKGLSIMAYQWREKYWVFSYGHQQKKAWDSDICFKRDK